MFDQSNNSQSNVERTWKTLASAICTEISRTQLSQKLQKSLGVEDIVRATLSLQRVGKSSFEMHVFKICVKGDAKWSGTSLMNLVGMLSGPVEQSDRSALLSRITS